MSHVNLTQIIEKMKLENLTPEIDVKGIKITQPDINRPALQMAGYFEHYEATRLQIIGFVEYTYMEAMTEERKNKIYNQLLSYPIPCIVFSRELHPDPLFPEMCIRDSDKEGDLRFYGGNYPLAECDAGALHFRARRAGGRLWRRRADYRREWNR